MPFPVELEPEAVPEQATANYVPDAAAPEAAENFSIAQFLAAEQGKDLLRFSTAGSVDDGKSTLIGRLLYDSRNVYEDHVRAVTRSHGAQGQPTIDFAQLTDGLRAEREQGITIDVAYRYFSTQRRKFIIADTPGHEQYTRNMATGASTADLAIILIDARKGILTQSRRHAYIASLLGIRHLVAAVNKMDLVDFSREVFAQIERELHAMVGRMAQGGVTPELHCIPVSALDGDNVVERSMRMPWYTGPSLLEHLESVPAVHAEQGVGFRLPVQRVIRPDQHYRGFAGQIAAGTVQPGDSIIALPSGRTSKVASITTFDGDLLEASAPQSVAITLEDELDISRGDLIAAIDAAPQTGSHLEASLVWFDANALDTSRVYLLQHTSHTVKARITRVLHKVNVETLRNEETAFLDMNGIGVVELETSRPLFFDAYTNNRATGSFILIDAESNATAAAGMIRSAVAQGAEYASAFSHTLEWGHKPALLTFHDATLLAAIEQSLLDRNCAVVRTRVQDAHLSRALLTTGVIVLLDAGPAATNATKDAGRVTIGFPDGAELYAKQRLVLHLNASETAAAVTRVIDALESRDVLPSTKLSDTSLEPA